jgi:hypothetical protein
MSEGRFSLGIHFNEHDELEVFCIDGEDGPDDTTATFKSLIEDWIAVEALGGELHPYLDDTLNMLAMLTYAQRRIIACLPADDPCAAEMAGVLETMASLLERLKDRLR